MTRRVALIAAACAWPGAAFAQAENIAKGVDVGVHAASDLIDKGGLLADVAIIAIVAAGIIIGFLTWAVVSLFRIIVRLQKERADDATTATKAVTETSIAGSTSISDSNKRLDDHSDRIQTLAERLLPLPEKISGIDTTLKELSRDIRDFKARNAGGAA